MRYQIVEDGAIRSTYKNNMFKDAEGNRHFSSAVYRLHNKGGRVYSMEYAKDKLEFDNRTGDADGECRWDVSRNIKDKPTVICETRRNLDEEPVLEIQFLNIGTDEIDAIGGKTYDIKDALKELGFRWNKEAKRWERRERDC